MYVCILGMYRIHLCNYFNMGVCRLCDHMHVRMYVCDKDVHKPQNIIKSVQTSQTCCNRKYQWRLQVQLRWNGFFVSFECIISKKQSIIFLLSTSLPHYSRKSKEGDCMKLLYARDDKWMWAKYDAKDHMIENYGFLCK